jgi:hypothetical protein
MIDNLKKYNLELNILELRNRFSDQKYALKADLRNFYRHLYPEMTEQAFRRILYALEKQNLIVSVGRGIYFIQNPLSFQQHQKKKFAPALSRNVKKLNDEIKETFPYISYLVWETKILHDFMVHQPGQNQVNLETEKGTEDSVFNHLSDKYLGKIFLNPNRMTMERYVIQQPESFLISKLVTQTPIGKKISGVPYAKIEKILVDILVDDEKYYVFQGQELVSIFENVFANYWIDEKSLFRYAGRRNALPKLNQFILNQTQIKFIQFNEDTP